MDRIKRIHSIGAVFTAVAGTLLHFAYEWSGGNEIVALFSAVNESTWEHLKLLAVPYLLFAVYEFFAYGKTLPNFLAAKVYALLAGMGTIVVLFYVYSGILGFNIGFVNILIFLIGVVVSYALSYRWMSNETFAGNDQSLAAGLLVALLLLCFWIFTETPPQLGLFQDPNTGRYGI